MSVTINTDGLTPMQLGRLNKSLAEQYRFSEGVFTLREYIIKYGVGKRLATVGTKSGIKEGVPSLDIGDGRSIDIPKMVYNCLSFDTE